MRVSLLTTGVLLRGILHAAEHKDIGHLDAEKTLKHMRDVLNKKIHLPQEVVESALFACRLLEENGEELGHPDGMSWANMVTSLCGEGYKFDPEFSLFEKKEEK